VLRLASPMRRRRESRSSRIILTIADYFERKVIVVVMYVEEEVDLFAVRRWKKVEVEEAGCQLYIPRLEESKLATSLFAE
jgi:hypothetical protein